tara:strand:- start:586 stop:864 length:279 start_codon:yes stop_codon:yes gene_type:complete
MLGVPMMPILSLIGSVFSFVFRLIYYILIIILPTLIQYVGVPLFLFGCLTGFGVSGAVLLVIIAFFVIYYNYLKRVKNINPYEKAKEKLEET